MRKGGRDGQRTDGGEVHGLHGGGHPLSDLAAGAGIDDGDDGESIEIDVVPGEELLPLGSGLVALLFRVCCWFVVCVDMRREIGVFLCLLRVREGGRGGARCRGDRRLGNINGALFLDGLCCQMNILCTFCHYVVIKATSIYSKTFSFLRISENPWTQFLVKVSSV